MLSSAKNMVSLPEELEAGSSFRSLCLRIVSEKALGMLKPGGELEREI